MKIIMEGIDFNGVCLDMRQTVAINSNNGLIEMCKKIKSQTGAGGVVIVSTCNRTEVYACFENDASADFIHIINPLFNGKTIRRYGEDAMRWLMEVACGIHSQLQGDGQIITQLVSAIEISCKNGCSCAELNTLFRLAVTAGKRAISENIIKPIPESAAFGGVSILKNKYGSLVGKKAVVIGNGKMGRLVQRLLLKNGCNVIVTLREYKTKSPIESGCDTVPYSERYKKIDGVDFVISATRSLHFTITYDRLKQLKNMPDMLIDLAVPRDIEPMCAELSSCYCLDDLNITPQKLDDKQKAAIDKITDKYYEEYRQWYNYRCSLKSVYEIKKLMETYNGDKAVGMVLGGLKAVLNPQVVNDCVKKIRERTKQ